VSARFFFLSARLFIGGTMCDRPGILPETGGTLAAALQQKKRAAMEFSDQRHRRSA
jgi:hypothetical protein